MSTLGTSFRSMSLAIVLTAATLTTAATHAAEPEPHQVPLLPLVWVIPESLQMPFPLQCVVGAVKPELTPILPPLSCPVIQPRSVSVSEIMWRRVFSRRSIERE